MYIEAHQNQLARLVMQPLPPSALGGIVSDQRDLLSLVIKRAAALKTPGLSKSAAELSLAVSFAEKEMLTYSSKGQSSATVLSASGDVLVVASKSIPTLSANQLVNVIESSRLVLTAAMNSSKTQEGWCAESKLLPNAFEPFREASKTVRNSLKQMISPEQVRKLESGGPSR